MYVIKFTFNRNTPDDISAPQIELKVSYHCFLSCFEGWEIQIWKIDKEILDKMKC